MTRKSIKFPLVHQKSAKNKNRVMMSSCRVFLFSQVRRQDSNKKWFSRSRAADDGTMNPVPIVAAARGSWCWWRAVVHQSSSILLAFSSRHCRRTPTDDTQGHIQPLTRGQNPCSSTSPQWKYIHVVTVRSSETCLRGVYDHLMHELRHQLNSNSLLLIVSSIYAWTVSHQWRDTAVFHWEHSKRS